MLNFRTLTYKIIILCFLIFHQFHYYAQALSVSSCPNVDKLNNGNGQAASAAGIFPGYGQNNPVADNVVGTSYQTVNFDPASKTGNYILKWPAASAISNVPIITRAWVTNASNVTTLSSAVFGPPPPPLFSGGNNYVNYSFYVSNLPPSGRVTLEFSDPVTGMPAFYCTYDLNSGTSAIPPTFSCTPTISSSPSSQTLCDDGTTSFIATSSGVTSYVWQYSSNGGSTWNDISQGGNFTYVSKDTLTIANRLTYTGYLFRLQTTNSCGTTNSTSALLTVNPIPTAVFSGSTTICGLNQTRSIGVTLTGTAPWTITYTVNGTPTTISGITASPYYFSVTPAVTTTYILTSVSDANCYDNTLSGSTTLSVYPNPTITLTNATACYGNSSFSLSYSSTNSPNQYSIAAGTRSLTGFTPISNASLTASPLSVTIPTSGYSAGVYDFNITVSNSTSGCSATAPFTLTVSALPVVTAISSGYEICSGGSVTLSAVGASTYSWSPSTGLSATTGSSVTASPTTTTTYTATGTSAAGCTSTSSVTITATSTFSVSINASATSTCSGGQITLTASGASSYSWSGPSSYSATGSTVVISPTATGTYTVTGTDINGCTATADQLITITGGPTITVSSNVTVCTGSSTTLTASGGTTYTWVPSSTLSSSTGASVTATPTSTTTYTVYGTTAGCTNTASVVVTVTSSPVTSVPTQVIYCAADYTGNTQMILSISTSSNQTFSWYRSTDNVTWGNSFAGQYILGSTSNVTTSTLGIKTPGSGDQYYKVEFTTSGCTFSYPIAIKKLGTAASDVSSAQTICSGSTPSTLTSLGTTNATNTATVYSTLWQSSSDGTTFSDISGATSTTYSPGALSADTWYRLKITSTGGSCPGPYYSNNIKITIATSVANNTLSLADACTASTEITGSTPTGGNGSYTYAWEISTTSSSTGFSTVANVTTQSYTPLVPSVTTWYRRLVTSGSCSNATSDVVVVYPPISGNQISNGQTVCFGSSITNLSVTASGGPTGSSFTYLWYSSSDNSSFSSTGTTTSTYSPSTSIGTTYYKVLITKGACSLYSNSAKIVVNPLPTVTVSPSSVTVCSGNNVTLTASGATSYSWSPATDLDITTGAYVVSTPTATRTYTVTGTNTGGCTNTADATVTYSASPSNPTLSSSSATICNTAVPYDLSTFISSGAGTYEWFSVPNTDVSYSLGTSSVSASGTYYLYKKSGSCYSNGYEPYTLTVNDVTAPVVNASSFTVCSPSTVNLNALNPDSTSGTTLIWFTDNTHTSSVATPTSVGAGTYYLFAYSSGGSCYGTASSAVTVTVNSLPTISVSTNALQTCVPNTLDLTSTTTPSAGITYKWYSTNTNPPSSANIILQPDIMDQSGTYYVFVINDTTSCISSSYSSVDLTFDDSPELDFTMPQADCTDSSVVMSVAVTNGVSSPSYQWTKYNATTDSWDNMSNTGVFSGVTTTTLSISSNTGLDGTAYRCDVVSNGCSTTSSIGVIGVSNPEKASLSLTQPSCTVSTGTAEVVSYSVGLKYSINGGAFVTSTTFSSLPQDSTYDLVTKDDLGCLSQTKNFIIDAQPTLPTTANAGTDKLGLVDCDSTDVRLDANAAIVGTGSWSLVAGVSGSFESTSVNDTKFTGFHGNSYTLRWSITEGSCVSTDDVAITICNQSVALPVELLSFDVRLNNEKNEAEIEWKTASELNSSHFILQKSKDGINFENITRISAAGNSSQLIKYSYVDEKVYRGINYYRLKQFDLNGDYKFSETKSLLSEGLFSSVVAPDPSNGDFISIFMSENVDPLMTFTLKVFSSQGILEYTDQIKGITNSAFITFPNKLASGMYHIILVDENKQTVLNSRFIVD